LIWNEGEPLRPSGSRRAIRSITFAAASRRLRWFRYYPSRYAPSHQRCDSARMKNEERKMPPRWGCQTLRHLMILSFCCTLIFHISYLYFAIFHTFTMPRHKYEHHDQREPSFVSLPAPKVYLYLLLLGLTAVFLGLAIAYIYTRASNGAGGVQLPPIFILNSILLLASSYTVNRANRAYREDKTTTYQTALWATFALTVVFMVAQIIAWTLAKDQLLGADIGNSKDYLYAISGLHFAHVVGGLPFLLLFMYTAYKNMREPVTVLIYFSDPTKRLKLELLTTYWHFLDGLWLFLVALFLANMVI
jgi:cytochrome c oxidase subunit III